MDNGFIEYKRLILDWHEQDLADRKEVKAQFAHYRLEDLAAHKRIDESLTAINNTLIEIKTTRRIAGVIGGYIIPAFMGLAAAATARAFGL